MELLRDRAIDEQVKAHRHAQILWALTAPHVKKPKGPPKLPALLRELERGER